jgi:hypothetical protein
MTIQEFQAQLVSTNDAIPVFKTLRKLMALNELQITALSDSPQDDSAWLEWIPWASNGASLAAA